MPLLSMVSPARGANPRSALDGRLGEHAGELVTEGVRRQHWPPRTSTRLVDAVSLITR